MAQGYFNSYCDLSVHELMLKDRARTLAYQKFFQENRDIVKDKVVMDVGAGTGILSLFAATAGARKVYAVEASDVADICKEIVEDNELSDVITVIKGPVEEISLPEGESRVDIIVSEWMGFYLLHESMLESVLCARDRFLSPEGILVPSHATIYMAPVNMSDHFSDRAEEWSNIYGFDFSPIASQLNMSDVSQPLIKVLSRDQVCGAKETVAEYDLKTMSLSEVTTVCNGMKFHMNTESMVHGFAFWFDVKFCRPTTALSEQSQEGKVLNNPTKTLNSDHGAKTAGVSVENGKEINSSGDAKKEKTDSVSNNKLVTSNTDKTKNNTNSSKSENQEDFSNDKEASIVLDTGPFSTPTHWKQTIVFLPQTIFVGKDVQLCCKLHMAQDEENKRHYNISLELVDEDGLGSLDGDDFVEDCEGESDTDAESDRARLIAALEERYDREHQELEGEAEMVEVSAEVEAAKQLDEDIERGGWQVEGNTSELSLDGEADT